jgi:hypothetical protein
MSKLSVASIETIPFVLRGTDKLVFQLLAEDKSIV